VTSGTTNVYDKKYANTLSELINDSLIIASAVTNYYAAIQTNTNFSHNSINYGGILVYGDTKIPDNKVFIPFSKNNLIADDVSFQRSYFILNQEIVDDAKYTTFKQQIIGSLINNQTIFGNGDSDLTTQFDAYWKTVAKPLFVGENSITQTFLNEMEKTSLKNYLNFTPFNGAKVKKYELFYTNETDSSLELPYKERRTILIKALGKSANEYETNNTWSNQDNNGLMICKVKLN